MRSSARWRTSAHQNPGQQHTRADVVDEDRAAGVRPSDSARSKHSRQISSGRGGEAHDRDVASHQRRGDPRLSRRGGARAPCGESAQGRHAGAQEISALHGGVHDDDLIRDHVDVWISE